ncbi:hypothetical protein FACS189483_11420 [Spirochaetia bacterium]|nr:hypothetical protein FACS189483_11420 [Spirochaetia bacterium]
MNVFQKKNASLRGSRFAGRLVVLGAVIGFLFAGCEAGLPPLDTVISERTTTTPVDVESLIIEPPATGYNSITVTMTGGTWSAAFMSAIIESPLPANLSEFIELVWYTASPEYKLITGTQPFTVSSVGKTGNDIILYGDRV